MNKKSVMGSLSLIVCLGIFAFFQNCGKGFQPAASNFENASSSVSNNAGTLSIASATPSLLTEAPLTFKLSGISPTSSSSVNWSQTFDGTTPCTQDVNDTDPTEFGVDCTVPGNLVVTASAIDSTGVMRQQTFSGKVFVNPNPPPSGGDHISFTIPSGTGNKSWNTVATTIELYIGMTLTIVNGDTVPHQLHVDRYDTDPNMNGHPCAHQPNPSAPGQSYDCVVTKEYDPAVDPIIWDHLSGTSARFYLRAYDGAALYTTNCAGCHGSLANSTKHNVTAAQIASAISSVTAMKNTPALVALTPTQQKAIAFALKQ